MYKECHIMNIGCTRKDTWILARIPGHSSFRYLSVMFILPRIRCSPQRQTCDGASKYKSGTTKKGKGNSASCPVSDAEIKRLWDLSLIVRDEEVGGSNSLASTIFSRVSILPANVHSACELSCVCCALDALSCKAFARDQSFFSKFIALR
jgi:hypothetical protein